MQLFTDSSCDLSKDYFSEHDVTLFPLRVLLNGEEYDDILAIESQQIYEAIAHGAQPKTSQVSPELFLAHFEQLAKNNEEGLYIAFSSELSGTYSTAMMIRDQVLESYPKLQLTIIDTKCASLGQGLLVKEAVRLRNQGKTCTEIATAITELAENMEHLFTVDDLDYLARGGRVSKASAFLGGLLSIKPILNVEDGKLVPIEKVRGHKKSITHIVDLMEQRGGDFSDKIVGICHSNDPAFLEEMKAAIEARLSPKGFDTTVIGSVIGSHVGLGTVGIFFTNKNYLTK